MYVYKVVIRSQKKYVQYSYIINLIAGKIIIPKWHKEIGMPTTRSQQLDGRTDV